MKPMQEQEDLPVYRKIAAILQDSIKAGRLTPGTILMEGSLAAIFGSSRTPVKQALSDLSERGVIQRFDGRGFVVGSAEAPQRIPVTAGLLGLDEANPELPRTWAWQRIYDGVERALIFHSALGKFRVNEVELARHYKVGRTVAHDVLVQAQSTGLLAKDERLRWYVVPLDEKRVCDLYDLRELLEPKAIATSVGRVPPEFLAGMIERLEAAIAAYPKVSAAEMDALEHGLHVTSLGYCDNREIMEALKRTANRSIARRPRLRTFAFSCPWAALAMLSISSWAARPARHSHVGAALSCARSKSILRPLSMIPAPSSTRNTLSTSTRSSHWPYSWRTCLTS